MSNTTSSTRSLKPNGTHKAMFQTSKDTLRSQVTRTLLSSRSQTMYNRFKAVVALSQNSWTLSTQTLREQCLKRQLVLSAWCRTIPSYSSRLQTRSASPCTTHGSASHLQKIISATHLRAMGEVCRALEPLRQNLTSTTGRIRCWE